MKFKGKYFNPPRPKPSEFAGKIAAPPAEAKPVYRYKDRIKLAVNVAMAADRPLLLAGPPGSGKTTLAKNIAEVKGWRFLDKTVTSRTRADDLLAEFDTLRRLSHAQEGGELLRKEAYVEPGVLWWAFDPESARWRGVPKEERDKLSAKERKEIEITKLPGEPGKPGEDSVVVLLDEIDKAEPDVPNDLLEPLDRGSFEVRTTSHPVRRGGHDILLLITTNGERELPPAFLRRCVVLALEEIDREWLVEVGKLHFGSGKKLVELYGKVADKVMVLHERALEEGLREPSTAEFLNAVRASHNLGILPGSEHWGQLDGVVTHAVAKPMKTKKDPKQPEE